MSSVSAKTTVMATAEKMKNSLEKGENTLKKIKDWKLPWDVLMARTGKQSGKAKNGLKEEEKHHHLFAAPGEINNPYRPLEVLVSYGLLCVYNIKTTS